MPMPYLTAALLCERVLIEQDGTVSIIRIADRVGYRILPGLPEDVMPMVQVSLYIALKSGEFSGNVKIHVVVNSPTGDSAVGGRAEANLIGGDSGINISTPVSIPVQKDGIHWFKIMVNDQHITSIPLMIVREQLEESSTPGHSEASSPAEK